MQSNNTDAGLHACEIWCADHNKTEGSLLQCVHNCIAYYKKHPKKVESMSVLPGGENPGPTKGLVRGYKGPLKGTSDGPPVLVRKSCLKLKNCQ